jgi:hypothetical protein
MSNDVLYWNKYWEKYDDLEELDQMSDDIDSTLQGIELGLNRKLLSGDHLLIISALEERIEELEAMAHSV